MNEHNNKRCNQQNLEEAIQEADSYLFLKKHINAKQGNNLCKNIKLRPQSLEKNR